MTMVVGKRFCDRRASRAVVVALAFVGAACLSIGSSAQENSYKLTWHGKNQAMSVTLTEGQLKHVFDTDGTVVTWNRAELAVYLAAASDESESCVARVSRALDEVLAEFNSNLSLHFTRTPNAEDAHVIIDFAGRSDPEYRIPARLRTPTSRTAFLGRGGESTGETDSAVVYDEQSNAIEFAYGFNRTLCQFSSDTDIESPRWFIGALLNVVLRPGGPNYERFPNAEIPSGDIPSTALVLKLVHSAGLRPGQRMRVHWEEYVTEAKRHMTLVESR